MDPLMYVCPMHPTVRQDRSGSCSICHMALVPESLSPAERMAAHQAVSSQTFLKTYQPLIVILVVLLLAVAVHQWYRGEFVPREAMRIFMAGFFIVFAGFKLTNLRGFADAYQTYDVIAKRSRAYAYAYPFIELALGLAYLFDIRPVLTNGVTIVVMGISSIGVYQAVKNKSVIQCACLGTFFKLPMPNVTLFEDVLMVAMAALSLWPLVN